MTVIVSWLVPEPISAFDAAADLAIEVSAKIAEMAKLAEPVSRDNMLAEMKARSDKHKYLTRAERDIRAIQELKASQETIEQKKKEVATGGVRPPDRPEPYLSLAQAELVISIFNDMLKRWPRVAANLLLHLEPTSVPELCPVNLDPWGPRIAADADDGGLSAHHQGRPAQLTRGVSANVRGDA